MQTITLTADAIIAGRSFKQGATVLADASAVESGYREAERRKVRARIEVAAGDATSILGTQADMVGICLVGILADIVSLDTHAGNEGQRERLRLMEEALGGDVAARAREALNKITSGEAKLTAVVKGVGSALDEALTRSTQTATILEG